MMRNSRFSSGSRLDRYFIMSASLKYILNGSMLSERASTDDTNLEVKIVIEH